MAGKPVRRLRDLRPEEFHEWAWARMEVGRAKYGDAHLHRYGLVDVVEELLDAANILHLTSDRLQQQGAWREKPVLDGFSRVRWMIAQARDYVLMLDRHLPDHVCTDERGGTRIWWPGRGSA